MMTTQVSSGITLNRALPGFYVDKMRDGLSESAARNHRQLYSTCLSMAMSARLRGWSQADFVNELADNRNRFWQQLTTGRDGRPIPTPRAYRVVHKVWDTAGININNLAPRTGYDISQDARERALLWTDRLTDEVDGLSKHEAAVMRYVVAETERRGMRRVTCPGRDVSEFAKIGHGTAARTLGALTERRFLIKHYAGRRGAESRRAAIYELADPWHNSTTT